MKFFSIIKRVSERVPDKNFQLLHGKPLWRNLIDELSEQDVFVNTDCVDLLKAQGADSIKNLHLIERSQFHVDWEESKSGSSPVLDMVKTFIEDYVPDHDETIVLTHVTSPFLRLPTVLQAAKKLDDGYKSIHSVARIQDFCWLSKDDATIPINFTPEYVQKTQDLQPVLASKGAFFIFKAGDFLEYGSRIIDPCLFYELSPLESIEIDFPADLEFARQLSSTV